MILFSVDWVVAPPTRQRVALAAQAVRPTFDVFEETALIGAAAPPNLQLGLLNAKIPNHTQWFAVPSS